MDNKEKQDKRDRIKVDAKDPNEVEYLHQQHSSYSHAEILEAIKNYGPYREDIENHLKENSSKK